jgi:hypothetical protein
MTAVMRRRKTKLHTMRCARISHEDAGASSGQYRGNRPQRVYAPIP